MIELLYEWLVERVKQADDRFYEFKKSLGGSYKDGKKHGLEEQYYSVSQLRSTGNYEDGKAKGFWETFYENGKIEKYR
tara:strand:- start:202 stop:435 length:234 start_codon:yes stop_codon:yes gene_type:complete